MRTLYLDCQSGISGDMTVAALLDLGADREGLEKVISGMHLGCTLTFDRVKKNEISAYSFDVLLPEHEHSHGHHQHRNLASVLDIIDQSSLSPYAKELSVRMFTVVAEAEAVIHNKSVEEVHFHEVGAIDSIVDICAVAYCLDNLGIRKVIASPLSDGTGQIKCQHGIIPVPVPATMEICRSHKVPMHLTDIQGEMVTPTGAAIIAATVSEFTSPGTAVVEKIGYGAGKRVFPNANVLRAFLLKEDVSENKDKVILLETNIDDCSAETLGFCMEQLFQIGAKDAWFTPIYMKKSRPAYMLSVICKAEEEQAVIEQLFKNTSSIGLRRRETERIIMDREPVKVKTPYGVLSGKKCTYGSVSKVTIEYESAKALAEKCGISILELYKNYSETEN